jgi:RNA polymerase sigma-70 factor (ECF subfamily)
MFMIPRRENRKASARAIALKPQRCSMRTTDPSVYDAHEAEDLTQEFFARFLAKDYLASVDQRKGQFRSFLLASLKHFLANEWDKSQRQKRGGGQPIFLIDEQVAETRYRFEAVDRLTPERIFERRWAQTVLEQVFAALQAECEQAGKAQRFGALKGFLLEEDDAGSYAEAAARLGMGEDAVKSAIHRMRQRYEELFRSEIAKTVAPWRRLTRKSISSARR